MKWMRHTVSTPDDDHPYGYGIDAWELAGKGVRIRNTLGEQDRRYVIEVESEGEWFPMMFADEYGAAFRSNLPDTKREIQTRDAELQTFRGSR